MLKERTYLVIVLYGFENLVNIFQSFYLLIGLFLTPYSFKLCFLILLQPIFIVKTENEEKKRSYSKIHYRKLY